MASAPIPFERPTRGFVIEASGVAQGFAESLERKGLAVMVARTVDGIYLEPRAQFSRIVAALEAAGARVTGVRRAGEAPSWQRSARNAAESRRRLGDFRAAEWLPTLPAC